MNWGTDPVLTQNRIGTGKLGRKQRKIRRVNGAKKGKSEPKRLRFALETTYGPAGGANPSRLAKTPRNQMASGLILFAQMLDLVLLDFTLERLARNVKEFGGFRNIAGGR